MHELAVTRGILNVALKHAEISEATKIVSISLKVGEMRPLVDVWMQRYFAYVSRETIAEGAEIIIEKVPIIVQCSDCTESFSIQISQIGSSTCPKCGGHNSHVISGKEFMIKEIEVV